MDGSSETGSGVDSGAPRAESGGFSFVELLVTIVLIGTTVVAMLVGLRATIVASDINEERAQLVSWLQQGVDAVHREAYVPCTSTSPDPASVYQGALAALPPPSGWSGGSLQLVEVRFASIDPARHVERWSTVCDPDRPSQLLTIRVTSPDGAMVETVPVIRDG